MLITLGMGAGVLTPRHLLSLLGRVSSLSMMLLKDILMSCNWQRLVAPCGSGALCLDSGIRAAAHPRKASLMEDMSCCSAVALWRVRSSVVWPLNALFHRPTPSMPCSMPTLLAAAEIKMMHCIMGPVVSQVPAPGVLQSGPFKHKLDTILLLLLAREPLA